MGEKDNGWIRPRISGDYGSDLQMQSIAHVAGIWANSMKEAIYFAKHRCDGSKTLSLTFPAGAGPEKQVRYFWLVIAVDSEEFRAIPNPLNRFLLNDHSGLKPNADGSMTLWFAPKQPDDAAEPNWLPTSAGKTYNLTFRLYGPSEDVVSGRYFPPPLVERG